MLRRITLLALFAVAVPLFAQLPADVEPVLLPVFTAPIPGAHGSEFRTDFRVRLVKGSQADIYGLRYPCNVTCIQQENDPYVLTPTSPEADAQNIEATGTPGTFLYMQTDQLDRVRMNLRAYDTSRAAENFGTEIPIVRLRDFATTLDPMVLIGIPSDPRFRSTLRIYGYGDTAASLLVTIEGANGAYIERSVLLPAQPDRYHPGYVELSNFPVGAGMLRVTIIPPPSVTPHRWAFVSVTNNETQHITLITPQP